MHVQLSVPSLFLLSLRRHHNQSVNRHAVSRTSNRSCELLPFAPSISRPVHCHLPASFSLTQRPERYSAHDCQLPFSPSFFFSFSPSVPCSFCPSLESIKLCSSLLPELIGSSRYWCGGGLAFLACCSQYGSFGSSGRRGAPEEEGKAGKPEGILKGGEWSFERGS